MEKRSQKYESALYIISHGVTDFLDPPIKQYGQALLDLPAYKIFLGTDGKNLEETAKLFNLSETEQDFLYQKKRSFALVTIGSKRLPVQFNIPSYKEPYIKGGGR